MKEQSKAAWQAQLTPEQYHVCWEKGTERPYSGTLLHNRARGTYHCVCCEAALFDSDAKFDAGCGWPSFDKERPGAIVRELDRSHGMVRTEIRCAGCGAHLGHVFDDGPTLTGLRFCVNSVAMSFEAQTLEPSQS